MSIEGRLHAGVSGCPLATSPSCSQLFLGSEFILVRRGWYLTFVVAGGTLGGTHWSWGPKDSFRRSWCS